MLVNWLTNRPSVIHCGTIWKVGLHIKPPNNGKGSGLRKGIILAGGSGTRLAPTTSVVSKQLIPVYDKPMIYYPLSVLLLAGIRDILIITTPDDSPMFKKLLGNGDQFGVKISYQVQPKPEGLAQAYIIGEEFIDGQPSVLILGDNIFYGHGLREMLSRASIQDKGATVFGYYVVDPERYGVVEFDSAQRAISIEEKPTNPRSHYAVTGLYFYDGRASELARKIVPSSRGELEITSLNQLYLEEGTLDVELMGRGFAWLDTGTFDSMLEASEYVRTVQHRQGLQVCCPEEIAFEMGYIDAATLLAQTEGKLKNPYFAYLAALVRHQPHGMKG
jgi:glucose-1-phosphate thymidylyltransferase